MWEGELRAEEDPQSGGGDLLFSIIIPTFVATVPKGQGFRPTLKVLEGYFPLNLDFPNSQ